MTTRTIKLDEPLARFVDDRVRSGFYHDVSDVVRAGLGLLKARADREEAKLARLRRLIQEGLDDVEAGRFEEVDDVQAWLEVWIEHRKFEASRDCAAGSKRYRCTS